MDASYGGESGAHDQNFSRLSLTLRGLFPKPRNMSGSVIDTKSLVIVSNRLPFKLERNAHGELMKALSPGGLVTALEPILKKNGGKWIGWPGIDLKLDEKIPKGEEIYDVIPVPMSKEEMDLFYLGFSNKTLWPLMHCMPELINFHPDYFDMYAVINERFAKVIIDQLSINESNQLIWIHDYQLLLVSQYLREYQQSDLKIAYFHHIPWPPSDIFCTLPWSKQILRSILCCDLIGFHVPTYVKNFVECCSKLVDGAYFHPEFNAFYYENRVIRVGAFPIGCPYKEFSTLAGVAPSTLPKSEVIKSILGCDRLDYTKGIPERLLSFEIFLERYPEHRGKVVLYQIAVPSRSDVEEYASLKKNIDELVGRINGKYATTHWSPIHYLYRSFPHSELAGIYRDASIALITPLRDGMNLVCKEYIAAQSTNNPGILILSSMTGAAAELKSAILVNPYDIWSVADEINRALSMTEAERSIRIQSLKQEVKRNDVHNWVSTFLKVANEPPPHVPHPDFAKMYREALLNYLYGYKLALFITYDGTLAPFAEHADKACIPAAMRKLMMQVFSCSHIHVTIVSGRTLENVKKMAAFPSAHYVGSHGYEMDVPGCDTFETPQLEKYVKNVTKAVKAIKDEGLDNEAGSWVEIKGPLMTFHYRMAEETSHEFLKKQVEEIISANGLRPRHVNYAVEGVPDFEWDKGTSILHILEARYGHKWFQKRRVVYIGDDAADEEAFKRLQGLAMTFRVNDEGTTVNSMASYSIPGYGELLKFLEYMVSIMENNTFESTDTPPEPKSPATIGSFAKIFSTSSGDQIKAE